MKQKSPAILTDNKACLKLHFRLVFSLFQVSCVVVMSFPSARKVNLHIVGYVSVLYCLVCNIRSQTHLLRGRIYILDRIVLPLFCLFQNLVNSGNSMFSRLNVKKICAVVMSFPSVRTSAPVPVSYVVRRLRLRQAGVRSLALRDNRGGRYFEFFVF